MEKEQIEKYFKGESSETEMEEVAEYLTGNPVGIDDYFSEADWDSFDEVPIVENKQTNKFIQSIVRPNSPKSNKRPIVFSRIAVAASLIIALGIGSYFFLFKSKEYASFPSGSVVLADQTVDQVNNTDSPKLISLPDGSIVTLSPKSKLHYLSAFSKNKRDIYLEGKAVFSVHKDVDRPFTVYCKEVATTALGTKFTVSSENHLGKVSVKLLEGKILVRSLSKNALSKKKYYLLPGNEIVYNNQNKLFTFIDNSTVTSKYIKNVDATIARADISSISNRKPEAGAITFEENATHYNDVYLSKVLDMLAQKNGIKISYPTGKVANIKFVGTIKDNVSIKHILSDISVMNGFKLRVDTSTNSYFIQ